MGTQDDFEYALDFVDDTGVTTPTMLWDPSFDTWRAFGTTTNSQMVLLSADLAAGTDLFYGFGSEEQEAVLAAVAGFA